MLKFMSSGEPNTECYRFTFLGTAPARFMTYVHPAGQNLRGDFTTLAATIEAEKGSLEAEESNGPYFDHVPNKQFGVIIH